MNFLKLLSSIALFFPVAVLTSCTFGKDYERPEVTLPSEWIMQEGEFTEISKNSWWETFKDPALNDLIVKALEQNKDLLIATSRVEELAALYGTSRADLFPQTEAKAGYERLQTAGARFGFAVPPTDVYLANVSASWELDLWGRIRRLNESAKAQLLSQEANRKAVILSLITGVASSYIQLRQLDDELAISKQTLESRIGARNLAKDRFNAGVTSELEVIQAEAELSATQVTIPDVERRIRESENFLSFLVGENPGQIRRGLALSEFTLDNSIPKFLPSDLLNQRPDIIQSEQSLIASNANIGSIKAEYFPRISITGIFGFESRELSDVTSGVGQAKTWTVAPTASLPLFTAGKTGYRLDAAEARKEAALQTYLKTIQNAFKETEDALVGYRKSFEQRQAREVQEKVLSRYLDLAEKLYKEGQTSYLEVLDSQRNYFDAKVAKSRVDGQYLLAYINIFKTMGGSWID